MSRVRTAVVTLPGLALLIAGLILGIVQPAGRFTGPLYVLLLGLLALLAVVGALWKLRGTLDRRDGPTATWAPDDEFATPAPERSQRTDQPAGRELAETIAAAGRAARAGGTVADGLSEVRPTLRQTLVETLVAGGRDREAAETLLADGSWTDDPVAAHVLEAALPGPRLTLRERVDAWLFPERAVRSRVRRAVQAIASMADATLPAVPGASAPRTVPIVRPRLEELQRDVDGTLERAVDPGVVTDQSHPPRPDSDPGTVVTNWTPPEQAGTADSGATAPTDETPPVRSRRRRWYGGVAATILLVAAGLLAQSGTLLLAALIPLASLAVGAATGIRVPTDLTVHREITPTPAAPGQTVTVTLRVRNEGGRAVSDLRVVDGVPADLAVVDGTPRLGTTLRPGETAVVSYTVIARRGSYQFTSPELRLRPLSGSVVATTDRFTAGDTELVCRLDADAPPLADRGATRVGGLRMDRPGDGVTFHSTREYQPDDPADRIDWRHYARHGTLTTVEYERQVAASVVLVLDARASARVGAGPGRPPAVELGAYAAARAALDLLASGHTVGVAILGTDGHGPAGLRWAPPAGGADQRTRILELLQSGIDREPEPDDAAVATQVRQILELAPPNAHLGLFSPCLDDVPVEAARTWRGAGRATVLLSADVLTAGTVSSQHAAVRRRIRLARCLAAGVETIDWRRGTPLPYVIDQAFTTAVGHEAVSTSSRAVGGGD